MPLTVQQNGTQVGGKSNVAMASWWNDYHDLLTGTMQDQVVTLRTSTRVRAIGGPPGAVTLALAAGTTLGIGSYQYRATVVDGAGGESQRGAVASITTTSGNQAVTVTLPVGPSGTASRNLYRTVAGGSTFLLVATINDNTTTTYSDTTADASLGAQQPPAHPLFGGLVILDYNNAAKAKFFTDGAVWFDAGALSSDGSGNLTGTGFFVGSQPALILGSGSYAGNHIYVGPNQPSGMVKGDVWIKTPF